MTGHANNERKVWLFNHRWGHLKHRAVKPNSYADGAIMINTNWGPVVVTCNNIA